MTDPNTIAAAQHDDAVLTTEELLHAYEGGLVELRMAVAGMTDDEIRARPIPGKWSTLEVVCHVADCEQFFADRMKRTAAMDRPLLIGADGFRYPEPLAYQQHDLEEELQVVAICRRQMARVLRLVSVDAWQRTAVHSETGLVTLRQLVLHAVNHLRHHLRFIAEKRVALRVPISALSNGSLDVRPCRHKSMSEHRATIQWKCTGPDFLKGRYSREHTWIFDGGLTMPASPSPHVVPKPWSNPSHVDPEEALVAAVSSCHMLTFLWLASKAGFQVDSYTDEAVGMMTRNAAGVPWVSAITLHVRISYLGDKRPTPAAEDRLHQAAHEQCFIAQSIKTAVNVQSLHSASGSP